MARPHLHSSELSRCLADLSLADLPDPGDAFAEKLSQWIHFTDAITLSAVHKEDASAGKPKRLLRGAAAEEFARVQGLLVKSITESCSSRTVKSPVRLPPAPLDLPSDPGPAWLPYRRFYEAHQRDMELNIQPLRSRLRAALAQGTPAQKKLAALDATFDKILQAREAQLLGLLPALLAGRFQHWCRQHQAQLAASGQPDRPATWMQPGGWLERFCEEMRLLLLAELDLRLQPALGLLEAYGQDTQ